MNALPLDLLPAYHLLFGARAPRPHALDLGALKKVFRRRALETHPDRARAIGLDPAAMTRRFQELTTAYEQLTRFVAANDLVPLSAPSGGAHDRGTTSRARPPAAGHTRRDPGHARRSRHARTWPGPPPGGSARAPGPTPADHYWGGPLPDRELLLGQYLYYSGRISWRALIGAIHWQRCQRPHFGQLAVASGLLAPEVVRRILSSRRLHERTGDAAVRLGYLDSPARDLVMAIQRGAQQRLGQYFVAAGVMAADEVRDAAVRQQRYNWSRVRDRRQSSTPGCC